ncbi:toll/interleukin-1 receptor domain-containing protein [Micromonospora taraxaci]
MSPSIDGSAEVVRCFLSYSRHDNEAMNGIADEIKARIEGLYLAKTGRTIRVFVDRHDIGWGEDWRSRLAESVRTATAFIPLVTMNYFNREACREELMAFYSSAKALGVTELILPIALAGSRSISKDDPREEVQIIERLQFENLEDAWPYGFSSPQWMTALNAITNKLIVALERAENRIAEIEGVEPAAQISGAHPSVVSGGKEPLRPGNDEVEDEGAGLYDLLHDFKESLAKFSQASPKAVGYAEEFSTALGGVLEELNAASDRQSMQQRSIQAAYRLREPSSQLEVAGTETLSYVSDADGALRQIISGVRSFDVPVLHQQLNETLGEVHETIERASSGTSPEEMDQVVEMLKLAGAMNVSLRRSIAPGLRGLSALRDAMKVFMSWRDIPLI